MRRIVITNGRNAQRRSELDKIEKQVRRRQQKRHRKFDRIANAFENAVTVSILRGLSSFKRRIDVNKIERLFRDGRIEEAIETIPWDKMPADMQRLANELEPVTLAGAKFTVESLPAPAKNLRIGPDNPRLRRFIDSNIGFKVVDISQDARKTIQFAVSESFRQGLSPKRTAKMIQDSIGITEKQHIRIMRVRQREIIARDKLEERLVLLMAEGKGQSITARNMRIKLRTLTDENIDRRVTKKTLAAQKQRSITIARTEITNAMNEGQTIMWDEAANQGLVDRTEAKKVWVTVPDQDRSDICAELEGKTVGMDETFFSSITGESFEHPPAHRNCFDDKTEVLTNFGWKYFEDLICDEKILSVNLKSGRPKWVDIKKYIKYEYQGELTHYKNIHTDVMVTPGHAHVVKFRVKKRGKGRKDAGNWLLLEDRKLPKSDFSFLAGIPHWSGKNRKTIEVAGRLWNTKDFCEFMGYWLSEGNISKRNNSEGYYLKISQEKYREQMLLCAYRCFEKIYVSKDCFQIPIDDLSTISWFKQFGYSHKKYVPEEIKSLSTFYIKMFLDAYALGDGSLISGKTWKNSKFRNVTIYFTSSDQMAADLGELILKTGLRPSYKKMEPRTVVHRNGVYTTKYPCWRITEVKCTNPNRDRMTVKKVKHNGYVYDVELEKNHTLFVRRNGKVILSGNCRSSVIIEP